MRVGEIRALRGPNVYSHRPVLSMRLCLYECAGKESRYFPGLNELLLDLLPGLAKLRCCIEREGGFAERSRERQASVHRPRRAASVRFPPRTHCTSGVWFRRG